MTNLPPGPTRKEMRFKQSLPRIALGCTAFGIPDGLGTDTTSNSLNSRKLCYAPKRAALTDIVLGYPGFFLGNPEQDFAQSYTVTASIEYPIGSTPRQVFFNNGSPSATISPGRVLVLSDPLDIVIPAGAQFGVKTYATWSVGTFPLGTWIAAQNLGEWTNRGTGLSDHTLDNTALGTSSQLYGFAPAVYARPSSLLASVGIIGDSIAQLTADWQDPTLGYNGWGRAMRGEVGFINLGRFGDSFNNYVTRAGGRSKALRDTITHLIMQMGFNDLWGGASLATMQANFQSAVNPYLYRGTQVLGVTIGPHTTSTDGFITAANQTIANAGDEGVRQNYNAWLRANYASLGLSGIVDLAHALDPTDSGKFAYDAGGAPAATSSPGGKCTLSGGAVSAINYYSYNSQSSQGNGLPVSSTLPLVIYAYPGTPGSGATGHATTTSGGVVLNYTVDSGGSGYTYPPMIGVAGAFTNDGTHPNVRGTNEIIYKCGLSPDLFLF